jgi:hypothetical protein
MRINPNNESYEQVTIFDTQALFTSNRIDKSMLPDDVYAYDIRHSDDDGMVAVELKEFILVNHMGTLLTKEPIDLGDKGYIDIEDEVDFYFVDAPNIKLSQFSSDESIEDSNKIDVVIVEPLKQPYHAKIEDGLKPLQQKVNGDIQIVTPFEDERACLICNEEVKIRGLPLNREVNGDIIAGTFIIAGLDDDGDIASLDDKQINMYKENFNGIEVFGFEDSELDMDDFER